MPKTSQTKPTVGRIVWVWLSGDDQASRNLKPLLQDKPFRADVIFVDDAGLASVMVTDHYGDSDLFEGVQIFDPEDSDGHGDDESYATWMPYQKVQHDKQAFANEMKVTLAEEKDSGNSIA